jgi:hypothetical protein
MLNLLEIPNELLHTIIKYLNKSNIINLILANKILYKNIIDIFDLIYDDKYKITIRILLNSSIKTLFIDNKDKIYKLNNYVDQNLDFKIFQYIYSIYGNDFIKYQIISYFHELYLFNVKSIYGKVIRLPQYADIEFMNMINKIPIHYLDINLYNIYSIYISEQLISKSNYRKQFSKAVLDDIEYFMLDNMTNIYNTNYISNDIIQIETIRSFIEFNAYLKYNRVNIYIIIILFNYINYLFTYNLLSSSLSNHIPFINILDHKINTFTEYIILSYDYDNILKNKILNILNISKEYIQNKKMILIC